MQTIVIDISEIPKIIKILLQLNIRAMKQESRREIFTMPEVKKTCWQV